MGPFARATTVLCALLVWAPPPCAARCQQADASGVGVHVVQGSGHVSPLDGQEVAGVQGIVTAVTTDGFWMQTPPGSEDQDPLSSEGLFVAHAGEPRPAPGDLVRVDGRVEERRLGGRADRLPTTTLVASAWQLREQGLPLPDPVLLDTGRRWPRTVDDDSPDRLVGAHTPVDPQDDALDRYEVLEGMRVLIENARVVGPTDGEGRFVVVGPSGLVTQDGLLLMWPQDENPERVVVDDRLRPTPATEVGARLRGPLLGVLDGCDDLPQLLLDGDLDVLPSRRRVLGDLPPSLPETVRLATYNVQYLGRAEPGRLAAVAAHVVGALGAPDLLALQEIQDDSGPADDGTVQATATLEALCAAIAEAGGPAYRALEIAPADKQDGGATGSNLRVAFLLREDRGLTLAPPERLRLPSNPARVRADDACWEGSVKPLALQLSWAGLDLHVVAVHLVSKRGDDPYMGVHQPPRRLSESRRSAQARSLRQHVDALLADEPEACIALLGDFNDFSWSEPLQTLVAGGALVDMADEVPVELGFTYVYQGNAEVLDHVLLSRTLHDMSVPQAHVAHVNAGFLAQVSDHDPIVVTLRQPVR